MTKTATVIGAGPAGLMAAEILARGGVAVTIYDAMPSVGRKFLLAGRGGLNLTHSEPLSSFLTRYGQAEARLGAAVRRFPPEGLRAWSQELGQATFVGSSGRVFPTAMKASPLLRAWLKRLEAAGVRLMRRHRWAGWTESGMLVFEGPDGPMLVGTDATVLALGGASWPKLGSDGRWTSILAGAGLAIEPLKPANCGFEVPWTPFFAAKYQGQPLKNVKLALGDRTARGDVIVTGHGLEGGPVYGLSAPLRDALAAAGRATLIVALRPDLSVEQIADRLSRRQPKQSLATSLKRTLALAPVAIGLLQEVAHRLDQRLSTVGERELAALINAVPVSLHGAAPIERAISTAGGLAFSEVDEHFMLRQRPGTFVAGEMLDWEAPTGGYLLQGCFATGVAAGEGALHWLARSV